MSLKYSSTTADYLIWSDAMNLIRKLAKDENYKISLLIALGCFTGLRISDILSLRWKQILGTDEFTVIEKKTSKVRTIRLNPQLLHTLKDITFTDIEEQGFMPVYERQEITDDLHETCGFRTDYQFITKRKIKGIQKKSKRR